MKKIGLWDLPEIREWFSQVLVEVAQRQLQAMFPHSTPAGPGDVLLVDISGKAVYLVDAFFWDSCAQILARRNSALKGHDLAQYFRAELLTLE